MDYMAPRRRYGKTGPAALHWVLSLYLVLFFVWLLPMHVLSHEPFGFSDQNAYSSPLGTKSQTVHDPDNCQLCRTHGQLGAWPVIFASPIVSVRPSYYVSVSHSIPVVSLWGPSSLRAPPASA